MAVASQHHLLLLVELHVLYGFSSDQESLSRNCCVGDYLPLFQNITFANGNTVNLYVNDVRTTLIGTWESVHRYSILSGYKGKIFLDRNGTIWIKDIQLSDEAKYFISSFDAKITTSALQIHVMVAPNKHCKPKLKKMDNILTASLEVEDCGKPVASVRWVDHPHISVVSQRVVKLTHAKERDTYYACAETQALRCAKNIQMSDHCTAFTIEGQEPRERTYLQIRTDKDNVPSASSEIPDMKIAVILISVLLTCFVMVLIASVIKFLLHRQKMQNMLSTRTSITGKNWRDAGKKKLFMQTMGREGLTIRGCSNIHHIHQDERNGFLCLTRHGMPEFHLSLPHEFDRRRCIMPNIRYDIEYQMDSETEA